MPFVITQLGVILQTTAFLANAVSVHLSLSPPNPPVKRQDCFTGTPEADTLFENVVQRVTLLTRSSVWIFTCLNIVGTFAFREFTKPSPIPGLLHLNLAVGTALTLFSAALRLWCYDTLGTLFTFEITVRPKHELITHGPYYYVRHPSYTGVYLTLIGITTVLLAPGTWTMEYGIRSPLGALVLGLWFLKCVFVFRGMEVRSKAEDDLLRTNFGLEWEEYAKRVQYKFVPWVY